jgi:hypothetical protein
MKNEDGEIVIVDGGGRKITGERDRKEVENGDDEVKDEKEADEVGGR